MKKKLKVQILIISLLYAITAYIALPIKNKPLFREGDLLDRFNYKLGLDIIGGTELRLTFKNPEELSTEEKRIGIQNAVNIIDQRINKFGLKEPRIQPLGNDQILIQLPGTTLEEIKLIKDLVQTTGKVEFRIECEETDSEAMCKEFIGREDGKSYKLKTDVVLDGTIIATAKAMPGSIHNKGGLFTKSAYLAKFDIKPQAGNRFAKVMNDNKGKVLAILMDNQVIAAPTINADTPPSREGGVIGDFTKDFAQLLATVLNTGALPQSLKIISEETVGPTLGEYSIKQGINSLLISTAIIALFMVILYGVSGFCACLAMLLNLFLLISIINIFGATLTLPGLAGIVLTLAMALDANILIFERLREEYITGKTMLAALEFAHERALSAIVDSNITTLLAGIILIIFGAGSIKGFGITLSIGIITTLFTAIYISKFFLKLLIESGILRSAKYLALIRGSNWDFMKPATTFFITTIICIIATNAYVIYKGKGVFNIDFTGGSIIGITTKVAQKVDFIQKKILEIKTKEDNIEKIKYRDIEVQGIGEKELTKDLNWGYRKLQIRTKFQNTEEFKNDIINALKDVLVDDPIEKPFTIKEGAREGWGQININLPYSIKPDEFKSKVKKIFETNSWGQVIIAEKTIDKDGLKKAEIFVEPQHTSILDMISSTLYKELKFEAFGQILYSSSVGSIVATELKEKAIWALLFSWITIIIYLWFRFEFLYGLGAVIALIHDVLISFGVTALIGGLFPHSLGITLQMGMNAIAALLTVVGYSVNDTIVVFDFIRENKKIQKKIKFYDIINMSLNRTISRTILTSMTVFLTSIVLFLFSYTSNSSLAVLSFILIIGSIAGTYSSIYVATYLVYLFRSSESESSS